MDINLFVFILVGFLAQLIDGALGMAYGVSATTFLLSMGVSPAIASASVHTAEIFTTGVSGISHFKFGNVNKKLFLRLLIPGIIGGILGAYILTEFPADIIKPIVSLYLLVMGAVILYKSFKKVTEKEVTTHIVPLGFTGGFFDAIGGGGWGPIVTTTLVARGNNPRFTIGSVNAAEFFVTVSESVTFFLALGLLTYWTNIIGLIIGGVIAAPMAAYVCKKISTRSLMLVVGLLIILLSLRTIIISFL